VGGAEDATKRTQTGLMAVEKASHPQAVDALLLPPHHPLCLVLVSACSATQIVCVPPGSSVGARSLDGAIFNRHFQINCRRGLGIKSPGISCMKVAVAAPHAIMC